MSLCRDLAPWALVLTAATGCSYLDRAARRASSQSLEAREQECLECAIRRSPPPADAPAAAARFERACRQGDMRSCSVLGVMVEQGRGVPRDPARAAGLFQRACRGGNAAGCVNLGRTLEAEGRDRDAAIALFELGCHRGSADGCYHLGEAHYRAGRAAEAERALTMGCNEQHAAACEGLGAMYRHGHGVPADPERAERLTRRACELGSTQACQRLDAHRGGAPSERPL